MARLPPDRGGCGRNIGGHLELRQPLLPFSPPGQEARAACMWRGNKKSRLASGATGGRTSAAWPKPGRKEVSSGPPILSSPFTWLFFASLEHPAESEADPGPRSTQLARVRIVRAPPFAVAVSLDRPALEVPVLGPERGPVGDQLIARCLVVLILEVMAVAGPARPVLRDQILAARAHLPAPCLGQDLVSVQGIAEVPVLAPQQTLVLHHAQRGSAAELDGP